MTPLGNDDPASQQTAGAKAQPGGAKPRGNPERQAERLEQDIEAIRDDLGNLVTELDHRRHRLNPITIGRRYPWQVAVGFAVLAGGVIGAVAWGRARSRQRKSWTNRGKRLRSALGRAVERPERVATSEPNIGMKILTAAATAVAGMAARQLAARLLFTTSQKTESATPHS